MLIISRNRIHISTEKILVYAKRQFQPLSTVYTHCLRTIDTMLNFDVDAQCEQGLMSWLFTLINSEKTLQEILQKELNRKRVENVSEMSGKLN